MLTLSLLLLAQSASVPAPMAAETPAPEKPEIVCVRAGDPPPGFARWTATPGKPNIGTPFMLTAVDGAASATFTVAKPGTYRIALSEGAWIDLLSGGTALISTGHSHGPACTGIRKLVDFKLAKGRYVLRLTKLKVASAKAMIAPAR